jgi:tol-pal system protein YbgF
MTTCGKLLLVGILGLVLLAPPAYPQDTKDLLNLLMKDSINLKNTVNELQKNSDQRNMEIKTLLQDILTRFTTMEVSVQKMNETLASLKATDEKSAKDLQETRATLELLKKNVDEGMVGVQNQVRGLSGKIAEFKTAEQPLPTSGDQFSQAWSDYSAGIYDIAVANFREFLRNYPMDSRASAAQYYIGDSLFAQKKYDQALPEFEKVLAGFPNSDKKCPALYRKGQTLVALKQNPQATAVFQSVGKECPNTQEAVNAAVDLKALSRPARGQ